MARTTIVHHERELRHQIFIDYFRLKQYVRNSLTPNAHTRSYETANGIKGEETGSLKKATNPDSTDVIIAQGSYSYTAPDGTLISLNYAADDVGGFQPRVSKARLGFFLHMLCAAMMMMVML